MDIDEHPDEQSDQTGEQKCLVNQNHIQTLVVVVFGFPEELGSTRSKEKKKSVRGRNANFVLQSQLTQLFCKCFVRLNSQIFEPDSFLIVFYSWDLPQTEQSKC